MKKIVLFASDGRLSKIAFQEIKSMGFLPVVFSFDKPSFLHYENEVILEFGDIEGFLRSACNLGVRKVVFAGKINATDIFKKKIAVSGANFLADIGKFDAENILGNLVDFLKKNHIETIPLTKVFKKYLAHEKIYTSAKPERHLWADIRTGWLIAKQTARMNIGQSVAVRNGMVVAVEASEGTDKMILRAGKLCSGFTVVKVMKNNQDVRFDLPTVGPSTIRTLARAGGKVLAVEAGRTIMIDIDRMVYLANRLNIIIAGFCGKEIM